MSHAVPPQEATQTTITRRDFLGLAGLTLVSSSLALQGANQSWAATAVPGDGTIPTPGKRPNIVLITTDQERYPRHWPENWVRDNLPAHKRLLANGLAFRRFFCNAAMCSPSRATLFTADVQAHLRANRVLNVPYTDAQIANAQADLLAQADPNGDGVSDFEARYPGVAVRDFDGDPAALPLVWIDAEGRRETRLSEIDTNLRFEAHPGWKGRIERGQDIACAS